MKDEHYMRRALVLARKGLGSTSPNPVVGCVIVNNGKIVGQGYHKRSGLPHAEAEALQDAGERARGGELYVTLEPCNHAGRTPPCTEAIIKAGIKRVIFAVRDPNPTVKGGGREALKLAGIEVTEGVLGKEAERIIESYLLSLKEGRPFVTLKLALTQDNALVTGRPDERWISSAISLAFVQRLRSRSDGIVVGRRTYEIDKPRLTNRLGRGSSPRPFVMTNRNRPLRYILEEYFEEGIRNLLCEGGGEVADSFCTESLADRVIIIRSSKESVGGDLPRFNIGKYSAYREIFKQRIGPDMLSIHQMPLNRRFHQWHR